MFSVIKSFLSSFNPDDNHGLDIPDNHLGAESLYCAGLCFDQTDNAGQLTLSSQEDLEGKLPEGLEKGLGIEVKPLSHKHG